MRHALWMLCAVVCVAASPITQKPSPDDERIVIDGKKNPELIPQWEAWGFAFRAINGGTRQLPSNVHRLASKEERAEVLAEAAANESRERACRERIEKLRPLLGKEPRDVVRAKQHEIELDCRWQTLRARDRLLHHLRPEVAAQLIAFVEDTKAGTTITMPKREFAFYRQPE